MRQLSRERIRQKVKREKERMKQRIDEDAPWWIPWAVKPLAALMFDREREPEEFIQIDHLLVGPPGVCLVETKSWEGAFPRGLSLDL